MYVPLVKLMSSGIFFLFLYKIVRTSYISDEKFHASCNIHCIWYMKKVQYQAKKEVGTALFLYYSTRNLYDEDGTKYFS